MVLSRPVFFVGWEADMDLEGNLILDRRPARRWVSALAVVIPVVACVAGVSWFVRAFISPPTISIPGPLVLSSIAPAPLPAPPTRAEQPAAKPESFWPAVVMPPTPTGPSAAPYAQQTAALGAASPTSGAFPPAPQSTRVAATTAFTDPARDNPMPAASAAEASAMPITGRIPLPRPRPPVTTIAAAAHAVPTPRTRPAEEEAPAAAAGPSLNAEPAYDRHAID
jgi:hypothetical protein